MNKSHETPQLLGLDPLAALATFAGDAESSPDQRHPKAPKPARRGRWIAAAVATAAVIFGGVAIASGSATGTNTSVRADDVVGQFELADDAVLGGPCSYDSVSYIGDGGRIDTTIGSYGVVSTVLSPSGEGAFCGYVSTIVVDPYGIERSEQFVVEDVSIDDVADELTLTIRHPAGVAAHGTLAGVPTVGGAMSYSGMLTEIGGDEATVRVTGLMFSPVAA
ncbi:MAG: hypothetical protein AAGA42_12125 [Actinomycetota bacterium]